MILVLFPGTGLFALTTEELLRLKNAGISDEVIVLIVENNYQDLNKVISLKEGGFKDQTIAAIVKGEVKNNPSSEKFTFETTARVKILWYLIYRGNPVLQNSIVMDNARIFLVDDAALKLEWKDDSGLGLLGEFRIKFIKSPFYWTFNRDDMLGPGRDGYPFLLQSTINHQGKPDTEGGTHYWQLYLDPKDEKIVDSFKGIISSLKSEPPLK